MLCHDSLTAVAGFLKREFCIDDIYMFDFKLT